MACILSQNIVKDTVGYCGVCLQEEVSISNNSAAQGAGIYASSSSLTMYGSLLISFNTATGYLGGGALYLLQSVVLVPDVEAYVNIVFQANQAKSGILYMYIYIYHLGWRTEVK